MVRPAPAPGQVIFTQLDDPPTGHEQGGKRPVLVLSEQRYNALRGLVICVPLTTRERTWPDYVPITSGPKSSWALPGQVRTLATSRFISRPAWTVTADELASVRTVVARLIGLEPQP